MAKSPRPIQSVRTQWRDVVLVCRKCSRKLDGEGFGPDGDQSLRKALRKALSAGKGRKAKAGVIEVGCFDVCPKDAVVVANAAKPAEWLIVPRHTAGGHHRTPGPRRSTQAPYGTRLESASETASPHNLGGDAMGETIGDLLSRDILMAVFPGGSNDDVMYQMFLPQGGSWSEASALPNGAHSGDQPAMLQAFGQIWCVFRGSDNLGLWYSTCDLATQTWSASQQFNGNQSEAGPAIALYDGKIFCVHKGGSGDENLYWCTYDPAVGSWSGDTQFSQGNQCGSTPALAVHNGQLICAHTGSWDDDSLWWTTFDGSNWAADTPFGAGNRCLGGGYLVDYEGTLFFIHRGGGGDGHLWWSTFDGSDFGEDQQFPQGNKGDGPPCAVAFDGVLYCVHRGYDEDNAMYSCTYQFGTWSGDSQLGNGATTIPGPALTVIPAPQGPLDPPNFGPILG